MLNNRITCWVLLVAGLAVSTPAVCEPAAGAHRIAFINLGPAAPNTKNVAAFRAGLAELGYVEGKNLSIDFRWADQKVDRLPGLVNEILALKPELIVSTGGQLTARAIKAATTDVPVVFITGEPVAEGIVPALAHPGGNMTGFALLAGDLEAKRLQLLTQIIPRAKRVAVVWNPTQPAIEEIMRNVDAAGKRFGLTLVSWKARNKDELDAAFREIAKAKADALFVISDPVLGYERARIVEFAQQQRMPGIYFWREFAEIGGLVSYGANLAATYRRSALYVDKILKGAKPGDLPIEQPVTFELVVNLKTAKSLGITVPESVRLRADEIIE